MTQLKIFSRKDVLVVGALFLLSLLIYVRTMGTDVMFGDSGEFQVLAVTGGLAHAFGYPIYLLIAKLFTFVPIGSLAERVTFCSAVFGGVSVAELYLLARALGIHRGLSTIAAAALMLSPLFWWQCVVAEEYPMSSAALVAILLLAVLWYRTRSDKFIIACGILGGVALGLHHAILLITPAVVLFVALARATRKEWLSAVAGIVAGSAVALAAYMAMGSIDSPTTSTNIIKPVVGLFGVEPSSLDSPLKRVEFVFFAAQFHGEMQLYHFGPNVPWVIDEVQQDFGWSLPILAIIGIVASFVRPGRRRLGVLIVGSWLSLFLIAMLMHNFNLEVEFIQAHVVMCVLAGLGLQAIYELAFKRRGPSFRVQAAAVAVGAAVMVVGAAPILQGAGQALVDRAPTFLTGIRREYPYAVDHPTAAHDRATAVVSRVPDGALLLIDWTYTDACYYVSLFEENKPGVEVVANYPDPEPPQDVSNQALSFYLNSARTRPVYSDTAPEGLTNVFRAVPILSDPSAGRVYLYRLIPRSAGAP